MALFHEQVAAWMAEPTTIALTRNGPPPLKRADIPDEEDVSRETSSSKKNAEGICTFGFCFFG